MELLKLAEIAETRTKYDSSRIPHERFKTKVQPPSIDQLYYHFYEHATEKKDFWE